MSNDVRVKCSEAIGNEELTVLAHVGATRWNGAALVATTAISDAAWATGAFTVAEQETSDGTATGRFAGPIPAELAAVLTVPTVVDFEFYIEDAPTPASVPIARQSLLMSGANAVIAAGAVELAALNTLAQACKDLIEADKVIDTSDPEQWELVWIKKGSGDLESGVELLRQQLKDTTGNAVTSANTKIGQTVSA